MIQLKPTQKLPSDCTAFKKLFYVFVNLNFLKKIILLPPPPPYFTSKLASPHPKAKLK